MDENGMPLPEPMWRSIVRHCSGCEERGTVDKSIPTESKERGFFVSWIPTDDWDPSMDQVIDDLAALPQKQKLILPPSLA